MLENSSINNHDSERAFSRVSDAIYIICKQLCPGQWCTRGHCRNYSGGTAYNCGKTRPSVCKEYKKYIEKQEVKKQANEKKDII